MRRCRNTQLLPEDGLRVRRTVHDKVAQSCRTRLCLTVFYERFTRRVYKTMDSVKLTAMPCRSSTRTYQMLSVRREKDETRGLYEIAGCNENEQQSIVYRRRFPRRSGTGLIRRQHSTVLLPVVVVVDNVLVLVVAVVWMLVVPILATVCFRVFGLHALPSGIVLTSFRRQRRVALGYSAKTQTSTSADYKPQLRPILESNTEY